MLLAALKRGSRVAYALAAQLAQPATSMAAREALVKLASEVTVQPSVPVLAPAAAAAPAGADGGSATQQQQPAAAAGSQQQRQQQQPSLGRGEAAAKPRGAAPGASLPQQRQQAAQQQGSLQQPQQQQPAAAGRSLVPLHPAIDPAAVAAVAAVVGRALLAQQAQQAQQAHGLAATAAAAAAASATAGPQAPAGGAERGAEQQPSGPPSAAMAPPSPAVTPCHTAQLPAPSYSGASPVTLSHGSHCRRRFPTMHALTAPRSCGACVPADTPCVYVCVWHATQAATRWLACPRFWAATPWWARRLAPPAHPSAPGERAGAEEAVGGCERVPSRGGRLARTRAARVWRFRCYRR